MGSLMYLGHKDGELCEFNKRKKGVLFLIEEVKTKKISEKEFTVHNEIRTVRYQTVDPIPIVIKGSPDPEQNKSIIKDWIMQHLRGRNAN